VRDEELLELLRDAARAVGDAVVGLHGRGLSGRRHSQYVADVVADDAAVEVLVKGGLRVVSEESGSTGDGELTCVLDPIDGSTNFDRGLPYYATSLCAVDEEGPRASVVANLATGTFFEAVRGAGATRDGVAIRPTAAAHLAGAVVAFSGLPPRRGPWAQYRAFGAASLELCGVADGSLDGYAVVGGSRLSPWDYLGGLHVLTEAGAVAADVDDEPLVVTEPVRRRPAAAATSGLLDDLASFVRGATSDAP
jgi:fructose-1,6-bisphosphatase/inositol monophosphatase family enzyme